jgi:hypothetical protein
VCEETKSTRGKQSLMIFGVPFAGLGLWLQSYLAATRMSCTRSGLLMRSASQSFF